MFKNWNGMSIRTQFLILGVGISLVLILLLGVTNYVMTRQVEQNFIVLQQESIEQANSRLTGYYEQMNRFMLNLAYDPLVQDYLATDTPISRFSARQNLLRRLSQAINITEGVRNVVIRPLEGNFTSDPGIISMADMARLPNPEGKSVAFLGMFEAIDIGSQSNVPRNFYVCAMRAYSIRQGDRKNIELGSVYMMLDGQKMLKGLGILPKDADEIYYVFDGLGHVVLTNRDMNASVPSELLPGNLVTDTVMPLVFEKKDYYVSHLYNQTTGIHLVRLIPRSRIMSEIGQVYKVEVFLFLALVLLVVLVFVLFRYSAVEPLAVMGAYFDRMARELGRRKEPLSLKGNREATLLADSFNRMFDQTEQLNSRIIEAEVYKRHSEIAMLRSQINPHFLYNTLETIKGMAFAVGSADIVQMVGSLSKVYRYSVKGAEFVPLREETDMLSDYLGIQQVRFPGRYEVESAFEPDTMDCLLPRMLLQPLVENALQHGLELKKRGGVLALSSRIIDETLVLSVQDNGCGFPTDMLVELQGELAREEDNRDIFTSRNVKIGILNVHGRLRRYYGKEYGLTVESRPDHRTTVTARLPVERGSHVPFADRR